MSGTSAERDPAFAVVRSVTRSTELVEAVISQPSHVAVISADLEDGPVQGLDGLRQLQIRAPVVRCIILLNTPERELIVEAFRSGAKGVFFRHDSLSAFRKAVARVHEGRFGLATMSSDIYWRH